MQQQVPPVRFKTALILLAFLLGGRALAANPLAEALDSPPTVAWRTDPARPFTVQSSPGALNGTFAQASLLRNESSWLEATVDGPGMFDFWLREVPGKPLNYIWDYWSLTIDGKPVAIRTKSWAPRFISGAGKHRIRLQLTNPDNDWSQPIASAVDEVSWIPLEATSLAKVGGLGAKWETRKLLPAEAFSNAGREAQPAVVIRKGQRQKSWVDATLEGPCEIRWDSSLDEGSFVSSREFLQIDGVDVLPISPHAWQTMRLTLPVGMHRVRWVTRPDPSSDASPETNPPLEFSAWRLSGFSIKRGLSPLAKALDFDGLFALERGDQSGLPVVFGIDDAWKPGPKSSLYFFDPHRAGKLSLVWGHPTGVSSPWYFADSYGHSEDLQTGAAGWQTHSTSLKPTTSEKWTYAAENWWDPKKEVPLLESLTFAANVVKPAAEAMESTERLATSWLGVYSAWIGIDDSFAKVGKDSAWSMVLRTGRESLATRSVTGPARISFWWKRTGSGPLHLSVDGGILPVPKPTRTWSKIEFSVGSGDHLIEWKHAASADTEPTNPSEAWLDGFAMRPTTSNTLTQAATLDSNLILTTDTMAEGKWSWIPISYREADGSWTKAVRTVSGSRVLSTTVNGPAVVEFRGRCFEETTGVPQRRSVVIISPGDPVTVLSQFISVEVDGVETQRIRSTPAGNWQSGAVIVPQGTHKLTFRLKTLQRRIFGESIVDAIAPTVQAWVDDLKIVSPASRYAAWAIAQNLPPSLAGHHDDADADGVENFLEYSFATDGLNAASKPPVLEFGRGLSRMLGESPANRWLKIPYLPAHAIGRLESSKDLIRWIPEPVTLLREPPLQSWFISSPNTPEYFTHPIRMDGPPTFYRVRITDGSE